MTSPNDKYLFRLKEHGDGKTEGECQRDYINYGDLNEDIDYSFINQFDITETFEYKGIFLNNETKQYEEILSQFRKSSLKK